MAIYTEGRQMRIFISGPITGTKDYLERFAAAERELSRRGYKPLNPAKVLAVVPFELSWEACMRVTRGLLDACDAIYMLKGWENSAGAIVEHEEAIHYGLEIRYEDNEQAD
jgi:hypothetical protein